MVSVYIPFHLEVLLIHRKSYNLAQGVYKEVMAESEAMGKMEVSYGRILTRP